MINFQCGKCGHKFRVADDKAGKKGRCLGCGEIVRIPTLSESTGSINGFTPEPLTESKTNPIQTDKPPSYIPPKISSEQPPIQSTQNSKSGLLNLAILAIIFLIIGIIVLVFFLTKDQTNSKQNSQDMPIATKQHFSDKQIEKWEKTVVTFDSKIQMYATYYPEECNIIMTASQELEPLMGTPNQPLEVWKKLEPLLRQEKPGTIEFYEINNLIMRLKVLTGMFVSLDEKHNLDVFKELVPQFEALSDKIREWKFESGHIYP